jgi:hypothetical protein
LGTVRGLGPVQPCAFPDPEFLWAGLRSFWVGPLGESLGFGAGRPGITRSQGKFAATVQTKRTHASSNRVGGRGDVALEEVRLRPTPQIPRDRNDR